MAVHQFTNPGHFQQGPFDVRANLRSSQRISITISGRSYELLSQRSGAEGRSLSNLASYLLETSLTPPARSQGAELRASPTSLTQP